MIAARNLAPAGRLGRARDQAPTRNDHFSVLTDIRENQ
jgi:hypothetical protein